MYYIYKATNKINGKIYIGQTVDFERRYKEHISSKHGKHAKCGFFHKAINEYGKENFDWEIIDTCENEEDAIYLESKYIVDYNSCVEFENSNGYNVYVSFGNIKNVFNSIKVLAYDLNGDYVATYLSCEIASRELKCSAPNIIKCLNGKRKSAGKHQFRRYEENFPLKIEPYKTNELEAKYKAVYQYDENFNFIQKHHSLMECASFIGVTRNAITNAMKANRTCKGYYFFYKSL